jgi:hypothetical protein
MARQGRLKKLGNRHHLSVGLEFGMSQKEMPGQPSRRDWLMFGGHPAVKTASYVRLRLRRTLPNTMTTEYF